MVAGPDPLYFGEAGSRSVLTRALEAENRAVEGRGRSQQWH